MRILSRTTAIVATIALTLALSPAPVSAQAIEPGETEVQLWPAAQPGQLVVIVSQTLPEGVDLPATVRLPVPEGMRVEWAGEILGETTRAADPPREFELKDGTGGQYAEFSLSESRQAQIELAGIALTSNASTVSTALDWVQSAPSALTAFSVRLPSGAGDVSIDPTPVGQPDSNEAGETLYTLPSRELEDGATQRVSVSYSLGGAPAQTQGEGSASGPLVAVLAVVLVLAVAALAFVISRQRRAQ
jgi:hypothetical protein